MKFIAIETATDICGVSYIVDGTCQDLVESSTPRKHAEKLPVFVGTILKRNDINLNELYGIALSHGPGSFTGLRIGLSYSKGLAYTHSLPLIPVPTLFSLIPEEELRQKNNVLLYSHGNMVFYQRVENGRRERPVSLEWKGELPNYSGNWFHYGCGDLIGEYKEIREVVPSAEKIGIFAARFADDWVVKDPKQLVPDYISPFKVHKKNDRH